MATGTNHRMLHDYRLSLQPATNVVASINRVIQPGLATMGMILLGSCRR
jgi:hypothetical protein